MWNWIQLTQDRVQWRTSVSTVMNHLVHEERRLFFDILSNYQLFFSSISQ
jgi:hypothetical protein